MTDFSLTPDQQMLANLPVKTSIFLEGPAGSGKTSAAVARLRVFLDTFQPERILILVPQRSLGLPYQEFIMARKPIFGGRPAVLTLGGLARRMTALFWPLVAEKAGFTHSRGQPQFLSAETAQYCVEKVITPFLDQGFFRSVTIDRNRLFGQILDNLNKSAVVPFPLNELAERLKNTTALTPELSIAYDQVQICAQAVRGYCIKNNLLDYSLLIETFTQSVWQEKTCQSYFYKTYQALLADNTEEDVPVAHDFIKQWIAALDSSLIVYDQNGGYRQFLGADPLSAHSISEGCSHAVFFSSPSTQPQNLQDFKKVFIDCIQRTKSPSSNFNFSSALEIRDYHFYPEMIQSLSEDIHGLVHEQGMAPNEIVVLSPYLSDALNFTLETTLSRMAIRVRSSRPSRKYLADPAVRAMLTLAKLAHPQWELTLTPLELRGALMVAISGMDVVRADLTIHTLFSEKHLFEGLRSFDSLTNRSMQERITYHLGGKIEALRSWLLNYQSQPAQPLDIFMSMLFGEVLSQNGFGLSGDFEAAGVIARVIHSIQEFRFFSANFLAIDEISSGLEYLRSVEGGLLPSAIFPHFPDNLEAVRISPAHTFLMENRQARVQYWLDIGAMGWWERLNQPLTNPYLLNRNSDRSQIWTDAHEFNANQDAMKRVVEGLINRCTEKIIVSAVRTNEYGSETRGPLQQAFQTLQKRVFLASGAQNV